MVEKGLGGIGPSGAAPIGVHGVPLAGACPVIPTGGLIDRAE